MMQLECHVKRFLVLFYHPHCHYKIHSFVLFTNKDILKLDVSDYSTDRTALRRSLRCVETWKHEQVLARSLA